MKKQHTNDQTFVTTKTEYKWIYVYLGEGELTPLWHLTSLTLGL